MSSFFPSFESFAKGTAATAAGLGTLAGIGLLYYGQNYLIYPSAFPQGSREQVPVPSEFGLPYTDLTLTTPDGVKIKAFLLTQRRHLEIHGAAEIPWSLEDDGDETHLISRQFVASRPTVIMFHGNGGNHGHRIPLARIFYLKMRCNVLMPSYHGYGLSEGTPSEKGLQMDAQTALDYVLQDEMLGKTTVIIYGQSIGGAVAIDLASKNPHAISALILENTFTSLPRLIPTAMPFLSPVAFLCHQKWESYLKVPTLPTRIRALLLGGVHDEVVPRTHMHDLWALFRARFAAGRTAAAHDPTKASAPGEPDKDLAPAVSMDDPPPLSENAGGDRFVEFGAGTHNDTCVQPGYWQAVAEFVGSLEGVNMPVGRARRAGSGL
ncbi:alpha/beta-hydrolase [Vararia minispora EC-137]|uniref:Alpha/beta-hydrolase n=1 Tax=Vararia minispora EC-137 TaxID=1314806 RepID=A0ACB8QYK6_9AGAM|nr:alpha/beta-hydrolase [Vararia minispora EC-137]